MIRFECSKCQKVNRADDADVGQKIACSNCGRNIRVPDQEEEHEEETPQRSAVTNNRRAKSHRDNGEESLPRKKRKASELLGRREATFQPRKEALGIVLVLSILLGLVGIVSFILTLAGKAADGGVALSMFMIPIGIGGSLWSIYFFTLKVVLHEGGIVHSHNGRRRVIPWEDFRSVKQAITEVYYEGAHTGTTYKYTLELEDGTQIVYTNNRLKKVEKLGEAIIEATSELLLPQARKDYDRGEVVDFGPLAISDEGLHSGNSLLKWRDIQGVRIKEGYVSVQKRGKWLRWCNVAAAAIPNLNVFLTLVNEIVGLDDD